MSQEATDLDPRWYANCGIVGLDAPPWNPEHGPATGLSQGYDGGLEFSYARDANDNRVVPTREDYIAVVDAMVKRWLTYRAFLRGLPDSAFTDT